MRIGLTMVVKDEANRIAGALDDVVDLFDEVVIIDTGSTDGTPDILRERYDIAALHMTLAQGDCLAVARNAAVERIGTPWVLTLDGDERVSRAALQAVIAMAEPRDDRLAGYFCAWDTFRGDTVIPDYKLALTRRDVKRRGLVHENGQYDLRQKGLWAEWLGGMSLRHEPEAVKDPLRAVYYRRQLEAALPRDAGWGCRYHWFLGYMLWRAGNGAEGEPHLARAAASDDPLFPVERLNAAMVLAEIKARRGEAAAALALLEGMGDFLASVAEDFEVRVNFRLGPWIEAALAAARAGNLATVRAYPFSC